MSKDKPVADILFAAATRAAAQGAILELFKREPVLDKDNCLLGEEITVTVFVKNSLDSFLTPAPPVEQATP